MKSAYELAMERMGGEPLAQLSEEQKKEISEVETLSKSKRVQAELAMQERSKKAGGDADALRQIRDDYAVEIASIESKLERDKEKIRNAG